MKLRAIIFDFDGVICESVEVKKQAFYKLFADCPQHVESIVEYHMENGGISRFKKFEVIYRDMLKKVLTKEQSEELGRRFSEYCYQGVIDAPFVDGAHEFLDKYYRHLKLFIVSGTPQDEMLRIVKERGLTKFFQGVYGSPRTKGELNRLILKKFDLLPEEVVFVGDSINDLDGAGEAGVAFIGRTRASSPNPFPDLIAHQVIKDLRELDKILQLDNTHIL
jgi:HAD superfamily hydrolase (TIGR01549 family)